MQGIWTYLHIIKFTLYISVLDDIIEKALSSVLCDDKEKEDEKTEEDEVQKDTSIGL